jgi:hypothetical protein
MTTMAYDGDSVNINNDECRAPLSICHNNIKSMFALFIIFIIVISEQFTNTVIGNHCRFAVKGRRPTNYGIVIQGIILVILFALASYAIESGLL